MLTTPTTGQTIAALAEASDLAAFRGGPFAAETVEAAAQSVRTECGWHIAPSIEQTIVLRTGGAEAVLLPSLRVTAVNSITDRNGNPVSNWDAWSNGTIERPGGFPDALNITFTHGYETCPPELLPIIAERAAAQASGRIKSEALAGRSVQLEGGYSPETETSINAYKITAA